MNWDKRYVLIFLSIFGLLFSSCQKTGNNDVIEIVGWQACYNQNPDLKDISARTDFQPINPTVLFRLPYKPILDVQHVWLKSTFHINDPERYHGISLGRVYLTSMVYINGRLCGTHIKEDVVEFHYPRNYTLPPGVLKQGENIIFIQLGVYGREFGGLPDGVKILDKKGFQKKKIWENLVYLQIPVGIMIFFAGLCFTILIVYMKSERRLAALFVLAIIIVWFVELTLINGPIWTVKIDLRIRLLWVCSFVQSLLFLLFIESYYSCYFKKMTIFFAGLEIFFSLMALTMGNILSPLYNARITGPLNVLITPVFIFMVLLEIKKIIRDRTILLFLIFGLFPGLSITFDVLNYLYGTHVPPFYHIFFTPVMLILVILLHRQIFIDNEKDVRILNERLNLLNSGIETDKKKGVSNQIEMKLNDIKSFIDMNFSLPFTREQLAEKTDLSPDYLSKMFKIHTGMKLNDYINDRRVDEACRLISETDDKIIDIAFSVGFESLATFNRAFIKMKGISPTEYRQDIRVKKSHVDDHDLA